MNNKLSPLRVKKKNDKQIYEKQIRFEVIVTSLLRKKDLDKKHRRTSPDIQFKEFSLPKQKTRTRMDNGWIGKII